MATADGHDQYLTVQGIDSPAVNSYHLVQVTIVRETGLDFLKGRCGVSPYREVVSESDMPRRRKAASRYVHFRAQQLLQSLLSGFNVIL